ncbi:MAG: hypothetical protein HOJ41_04255 [Rhodospirillaceae bacterium]|nr:hypothetical protein [Rhodospirillaceae bacterium]
MAVWGAEAAAATARELRFERAAELWCGKSAKYALTTWRANVQGRKARRAARVEAVAAE